MAVVASPPLPWTLWLRFGETVAAVVAERLPGSEGEALLAGLRPALAAPAPGGEAAGAACLVAYFVDVPAHRTACVQLDQSMFVHPIPLPGAPVPLGAILDRLSKLGPVPFGTVWMAVLDLAVACDAGLDVAGARNYIQQRMSASLVAPPATPAGAGGLAALGDMPMPNQAQLDGILNAMMNAFPGLGEVVQQVVAPILESVNQPGAANGADGATQVIENLQNTLLKPLLENLGGSGGDVIPAIGQIVEGFKSLNQALNGPQPGEAAAAAAATGPAAGGDAMMQ